MSFEPHSFTIVKKKVMAEQPQNIRDGQLFKFASAKRYLKIFVPDFAFSHDDKHDDRHGHNHGHKPETKDKFVGREIQMRKLYTWLTSESKSGSYLITGYRGMGKSLPAVVVEAVP